MIKKIKFRKAVLTDTAEPPQPAKPSEPSAPAPVPPPPPTDPRLGDKTPAFVEWVRDHDPEEFARRYAGRTTHLGRH